MFKEILESVQFLHDQRPRVIHRDLKPSNILLSENEQGGKFVKLCDFGLAIYHDYTDQTHTMNRVTEKYKAPELRAGRKYNHKCDIFSLSQVASDVFGIDLTRLVLLTILIIIKFMLIY